MRLRLETAACLLLATTAMAGEKPETEDQKTMYALGQLVASQLAGFALGAEELPFLQQGIEDGILGRDSAVDLDTYRPKINELAASRVKQMAEKERSASAAWVEQQANAESATASAREVTRPPQTPCRGAASSRTTGR